MGGDVDVGAAVDGLGAAGVVAVDGGRDLAFLVAGAGGGLVAVDELDEVGAEAGVVAADHEADGVAGGGGEAVGVADEVHVARASAGCAGVRVSSECRRCGGLKGGLACAIRVFSKKLLRRGGCPIGPCVAGSWGV